MTGLDRHLRWVNGLGIVAALAAAAALIANAPDPPAPLEAAPLATAGAPLRLDAAPVPVGLALDLELPNPPVLSFASRNSDAPLALGVRLPPNAAAADLVHQGVPLQPAAEGARLDLDRRSLRWGLNVVHIEGTDPFGRPLDQAWPLLLGDTAAGGAWIEGAVEVYLAAEGFQDDDGRLDDLAAIARRQLAAAVRRVPPIEAGPITVSNWRAGDVEVDLTPVDGGVDVHVALADVHVDVEVDPFGEVEAFGIHRMWLYASLRVDVHRDGSPAVWLEGIEPHVDINREGEGVGAWLLDRGAWFLEVAAELLSEEPIREALTGVLDRALEQWVSRYELVTPPPLVERTFEVEYRFSALDLDRRGLTARIDIRIDCPDGPVREDAVERITHPDGTWSPPLDLPEGAVARALLRADAVNGVLHAFWRCGALDAVVGFEEAHREMPLAVPERVAASFGLPPILQAGPAGEMLVGIGAVRGALDYGDATFDVSAVGLLPIELEAVRDGRALEIRFAADSPALELYTDCVGSSSGPCRDNPLFDRLAWLAVPYLPPIGAVLPLPDLRISTDPDTAVRVRLYGVRFDPSGAFVEVWAGYEAAPDLR